MQKKLEVLDKENKNLKIKQKEKLYIGIQKPELNTQF